MPMRSEDTAADPSTSAVDPDVLREVVEGLERTPKALPCKFFYDEEGSALFDRICRLPEYYLTRTELVIMEAHVGEMAEAIGPRCLIVELGSGSNVKTRHLLEGLEEVAAYVPIDISSEHLLRSAAALSEAFPTIEVLPLAADYTQPLTLPTPTAPYARRVAYFPGSTIGNFGPAAAEAFLERIHRMCGPGGGLLIGVDLMKPAELLEPAYNDSQGVTAAFNLNLLARLNREVGANFDQSRFTHRAVLDVDRGAIEMRLISDVAQEVEVGGQTFRLEAGEYIVTERSYKYTPERFAGIARAAGWTVERVWTDPEGLFSVQWLVA